MNPFLKRLSDDTPLLTSEALAFLIARDITADEIRAAETPFMQKVRDYCSPKMTFNGNVAIIPVQAQLAYAPDPMEMLFMGIEDSRTVTNMLHEAADTRGIDGVLIRMHTPGGMVIGGLEMCDGVKACRDKGKPVVTHVGGFGASLGYMLASQSNMIVANPSAVVGSIGVIASIPDYTALLAQAGIKMDVFKNKEATFKGAGMPGTSLTNEQRDQLQSQVQSTFGVFKGTVLACRPQVKEDAMRGQTFTGQAAVAAGLIDAVGSEKAALAALQKLIK